MGVAETVQDSEVLLKHLTEEPEVVVEALTLEERARVVSDLHVLADKAAEVRSEADLLYVANAVWLLVKETPTLAALLLPQDAYATETRNRRKRRKVSRAHHEAVQRESRHAQERAAQIRNHIVESHQKLVQALREPTARQSADD